MAQHTCNRGPLEHIAFIGRPEYVKYLNQDSKNEFFTIENKNISKNIKNALDNEINIPLALVTLYRLYQNGDNMAKIILIEEISKLIKMSNESIKNFIYKNEY